MKIDKIKGKIKMGYVKNFKGKGLNAGKINCWDFVKCGREFDGKKVPCPASIDMSADGLNEGKNGGRICWAIAGTFCREKIKGFFAKKLLSCESCGFFKMVKKEEGIENFILLKPK
jgi:hypothetical protein